MQSLKAFTRCALVGSLIAMQSAYAADIKTPAAAETRPVPSAPAQETVLTPARKQYIETLRAAHNLLGHVNLAYLACDLGMQDSAKHHVAEAQSVAKKLEGGLPTIRSDTSITLGKLSYRYKGEDKVYYIPVADDVFVAHDYDALVRNKRDVDVQERDAELVHARMALDIRQVEAALSSARADLEKQHYADAKTALRDVFKGAVTEQVVIDDPLLTVQDNLNLARNLIGQQEFDSARFALDHAQESLKRYQKQSNDAEQVAKLMSAVSVLQNELSEKDPTLLEQAEQKAEHMAQQAKAWFAHSSDKAQQSIDN